MTIHDMTENEGQMTVTWSQLYGRHFTLPIAYSLFVQNHFLFYLKVTKSILCFLLAIFLQHVFLIQ